MGGWGDPEEENKSKRKEHLQHSKNKAAGIASSVFAI